MDNQMDAPAGARRLVHCCYSTDDLTAVIEFLSTGLGLPAVLQGGISTFDGEAIGEFGSIEAQLAMVFDARGPRQSPAIEVQGCVTPPQQGVPYAAITNPGLHAIGVAVTSLPRAVDRAVAAGARVLADHDGLAVAFGAPHAVSVADSRGVVFDLLPAENEAATDSQIRHVRMTCMNLDRSLAFYRALGFVGAAAQSEVDCPITMTGHPGARVRVGRLRLPDEPCELVLHQWISPRSAGRAHPIPSPQGLYRMAVSVDDLTAAVDSLTSRGHRFRRPPMQLTVAGTSLPAMWAAFLCDPDGIPVELLERPRKAYRS